MMQFDVEDPITGHILSTVTNLRADVVDVDDNNEVTYELKLRNNTIKAALLNP